MAEASNIYEFKKKDGEISIDDIISALKKDESINKKLIEALNEREKLKYENKVLKEKNSENVSLLRKENELYKKEIKGLHKILSEKDNTIWNLEKEVGIDDLTGSYNRQKFEKNLSSIVKGIVENQRAEDSPQKFSLLFLDIDNFKSFNDDYGHTAGDEALKEVAYRINSALNREEDKVYRYGGEEFAVILPHVNKEDGKKVAERIRSAVYHNFKVSENESKDLSVSIGVASLPIDKKEIDKKEYDSFFMNKENKEKFSDIYARLSSGKGFDPEHNKEFYTDMLKYLVVQRSDCAMYGAKHAGKNRVYSD